MGAELSVSLTFPVLEPPGHHRPGARRPLPMHCYAPGQEGGIFLQAGAVTLNQRFGSALNLNIHFHMLFLDGVYVERPDGLHRFRCEKAPTSAELTRLAPTFALRIGRLLERQGLVERGFENSCLAG